MTEAARFEAQPNVGNHFAWIRTQMAMQRTLMAAVRTGVSLIGFGFTVAQFFEKLKGTVGPLGRPMRAETPRNLGLVLIAAGVASVAIFTWQYYLANLYMKSPPFAAIAPDAGRMRSAAYLTAWAVMLIGVAAFITVLARI
jgi:putative membrane protein